jgi:hypothetical protein
MKNGRAPTRLILGAFAVASLVSLGPVGCGGGASTPTATPAAPSPYPSSAAVDTPSPVVAISSPGVATPAPAGTPSGVFLVAAAEAAALKELNAIYTTVLTQEGCMVNNPARKLCILLESQPNDAFGGVLLFGMTSPDGGGAALYFGRMQDGSWHYWFGTQNDTYQLVKFPADGIVCARGGGLNVREQPSTTASVVTLLKDLAPIRAEEFVLTQPGAFGHAGPDPDGWYRISAPVPGWVNYRYVSAASFKTCEFHDAVQPAP